MFYKILYLLIIFIISLVYCWPDGAPCLRNVYETMNPLEAVEHQGGLQVPILLTLPPFYIELDRRCYRRGESVQLELRGNHTEDKFKGFVIQPLIYTGTGFFGRRIGEFNRLDDNGSWQQQCFRTKDSVTHSHNVNKRSIILWWRNDGEMYTVQFVATVVIHQKQFWVKSVLSNPLPPCAVSSRTPNWDRPPITPPPPPNQFKLETFRIFQSNAPISRINDISQAFLPRQPPPPFRQPPPPPQQFQPQFPQQQQFMTQAPQFQQPFQPRPQFPQTPQRPFTPAPFAQRPPSAPQAHPMQPQQPLQRQRLTHIIPVPNMIPNRRGPQSGFSQNPVEAERQRQLSLLQNHASNFPSNACADVESPRNCFTWISSCGTSAFMRVFCKRTCRFC